MNSPLDTICQQIARGRQLARQLAIALRGQSPTELEFRALWLLSRQGEMCLEQRGIAQQLGVSPAQVSTMVETLRSQNLLVPRVNEGDRRRQHWQLTPQGREQLDVSVEIVEQFLVLPPRTLREDAA